MGTKTGYATLTEARKVNPSIFDAAIRRALHQAADDVGKKVAIEALCQVPALHTHLA